MKTDNETRLKQVEDGLASLTTTMKVTVAEEVRKASDGLTATVPGNIAQTIKDIVEKIFKETEDRKNRANNLIIFNLPLSRAKDPKERKEHDGNIIKRLVQDPFPDQEELH